MLALTLNDCQQLLETKCGLNGIILTIAKKANYPKKLLNFGKLPKRKEQQHPKCFMDTKKIKNNFKWKIDYSLDSGVNKILKKNNIKHI